MKTLLITGGTGFLGSNLLKELVRDYQLLMLKRSFSDLGRLKRIGGILDQDNFKFYDIDKTPFEEVFQKEKIDIVLHCATDYGRGNKDPMEVISANLILPLRLLELSRQNRVEAFINTDTILDKRISYYSLSKSNFKDWLKMYSNDLTCVNLAIAHFYGPGDDKTKFISYVINELLGNAEKIDLTPGRQKRDFIYIADVVSGILKILENINRLGKGYHHLEIGTGIQSELKDAVLLIKELTGNRSTKLNFGALAYRENEVMELDIQTQGLRNFGWLPAYSLKEGLGNTVRQEMELLNPDSKKIRTA